VARPPRIGGTVTTGEETFEAIANGLGVALLSAGQPLATQLGRRPNSLRRCMTGESVTARTAQDVATLYQRLWSTRPPPGGLLMQKTPTVAPRAMARASLDLLSCDGESASVGA
jgi:hypothetical protein